MQKLNSFLEGLMEDEIVDDGAVAQDETQMKSMWAVREGIAEASVKEGGVYKYDIRYLISLCLVYRCPVYIIL